MYTKCVRPFLYFLHSRDARDNHRFSRASIRERYAAVLSLHLFANFEALYTTIADPTHDFLFRLKALPSRLMTTSSFTPKRSIGKELTPCLFFFTIYLLSSGRCNIYMLTHLTSKLVEMDMLTR